MTARYTFYVVDDDAQELEFIVAALRELGHEVHSSMFSQQALAEIQARRPDCVVTDLMMPVMDGLELCLRLRENSAFSDMRIVIVSGKVYEFDEMRARELGANGYIKKPLKKEAMIKKIMDVMEDKIALRYWGVRGTLPVGGPDTLKYGANTSCISMSFPNEAFYIFDAGSGIRNLGKHLIAQKKRLTAKLFISHPHWDHISSVPFFIPMYVQGNEFEVCGPAQANLEMRDLISAQMEGVYFPITMREFGSNLYFRNLREETLQDGPITVKTKLLSHPGYCLGYRVDYHGRSFAYVTDNELFLPDHPAHNAYFVEQLAEWLHGVDILTTDTTYTDEGYKAKVGWGHSCVSQVVELAHRAEAKALHLFHHDPDETDADIDRKLAAAQTKLGELGSKTQCIAPAEGAEFIW